MPSYALILTTNHRVLVVRGELPAVATEDAATRPLVAHQEAAARLLRLAPPSPWGSRPHAGGPPHCRDFAFVVQTDDAATPPPEGAAWARLAEAPEPAWDLYCELLLGGYRPPTRDLDVFHFGDSPLLASQLLHLVVKGNKRGTAPSVAASLAEGAVPTPGLLSVVTDGFGAPGCLIEDVEVRRLPFRAVGADLAEREGEGDLSLADWRAGHAAYFTREARRLGTEFDEDMAIFFEMFRVVKVFGTQDQ